MPKCVWCDEELIFIRGKGWVHQDGQIYKQKFVLTQRHPTGEWVDDHCALPRAADEAPQKKLRR